MRSANMAGHAPALLAIAKSEGGLGGYNMSGDHGTSFGPFQMHFGGAGSQANILASRGINVRDPSTLQREYGRQHGGWEGSVWHGICDRYHKSKINRSGADEQQAEQHIHLHVDGREMAHVVTKHQVAEARHITQAPYHDASRGWLGPDTNLATV
jgi:hypothetical protein